MSQLRSSTDWEVVVLGALKAEIERIAQQETEAAIVRTKDRVREGLASLVMSVMHNFDVSRMENGITIRVRNEAEAKK